MLSQPHQSYLDLKRLQFLEAFLDFAQGNDILTRIALQSFEYNDIGGIEYQLPSTAVREAEIVDKSRTDGKGKSAKITIRGAKAAIASTDVRRLKKAIEKRREVIEEQGVKLGDELPPVLANLTRLANYFKLDKKEQKILELLFIACADEKETHTRGLKNYLLTLNYFLPDGFYTFIASALGMPVQDVQERLTPGSRLMNSAMVFLENIELNDEKSEGYTSSKGNIILGDRLLRAILGPKRSAPAMIELMEGTTPALC